MPSQAFNLASHKAIHAYCERSTEHQDAGLAPQLAARMAFGAMLEGVAKSVECTLALESTPGWARRGGGTLLDGWQLPLGAWHAVEAVESAIPGGQANALFADGYRALLFQDGRVAREADLRQHGELAALLGAFFGYSNAGIDEFLVALPVYLEAISAVRAEIHLEIEAARADNLRFASEFNALHDICKGALDPNLRASRVAEMLVDELLCERLLNEAFPELAARTVIAREMQTALAALPETVRTELVHSVDGFYKAVLGAAATMESCADRLRFIGAMADRIRGAHDTIPFSITIAEFAAASIEALLETEFATTLCEPGLAVLDPCAGNGEFVAAFIGRMTHCDLHQKYRTDLFCNQADLVHCSLASLNIEAAYAAANGGAAASGSPLPFEGLCLADTLELDEPRQPTLFGDANRDRIERQGVAPVRVIAGRIPDDYGTPNRYSTLEKRVRETYGADSDSAYSDALEAPIVQFFRWATDRLGGRDGIVCLAGDNSFVDGLGFDGFRRGLCEDFNLIYHLDLRPGGARRRGGEAPLGITIAVHAKDATEGFVRYFRVPASWGRAEGEIFLLEKGDARNIEWETLQPDARGAWIRGGLREEFENFLPLCENEDAIFARVGHGAKTGRDAWLYNFQRTALQTNIKAFIRAYNTQVDGWLRRDRSANIGFEEYIEDADRRIKWSNALKLHAQQGHRISFDAGNVRTALYRPFCRQFTLPDPLLNDDLDLSSYPLPGTDNRTICLSEPTDDSPLALLMTNGLTDGNLFGTAPIRCLPLYLYDEKGKNQRPAITAGALAQFRERYGPDVTAADIFHYTYAVLHHPGYRESYAANLLRELPRIPQAADADAFQKMARIGARLAELHTNYEAVAEYPLKPETAGGISNFRVSKMRLSDDGSALVVNKTLTLTGIPPQCFQYRLGNLSALEWLIEGYRSRTDARSDITNDPNLQGDGGAIMRLVGQVVAVSLETVKLVEELAEIDFAV